MIRCRRFVPVGVALALGVVLTVVLLSGVDYGVADWLYAGEGNAWSLRRDRVFANVLHEDLRVIYFFYCAVLVTAALVRRGWHGRDGFGRALGYVALANALCIAVVAVGKTSLPIPCPWDLARYGGHVAPGGLLDWQVGGHVKGCFPAGHAVGGYAQFAWYYVALAMRPRLAPWAFAAASTAGLGLGLAQQARGAHFISHDVACALVCWLLVTLLARWFGYREPGPASPATLAEHRDLPRNSGASA